MMKEIIHMRDGSTLTAISDNFATIELDELNKAIAHEDKYIKVGNKHSFFVPVAGVYYIEVEAIEESEVETNGIA